MVAPDPALVWLNIGWSLSIILLPCVTALIADHGHEQATVALYVGTVALSMYCLGGAGADHARRSSRIRACP